MATAQAREVVGVERQVASFLLGRGWERIDIGVAMMHFEETHGIEAVRALGRFINWAEAQHKTADWIATQLGHDLNGCQDALMSPRTRNY